MSFTAIEMEQPQLCSICNIYHDLDSACILPDPDLVWPLPDMTRIANALERIAAVLERMEQKEVE